MTREDARALEALRGYVRTYAKRRGFPTRERDDIVQEVFLHALEDWPRFDPTRGANALRRWITGITSNVILMHLRYERTHPIQYDDMDRYPGPSWEAQMEARSELRALASKIEPTHWRVLVAVEGEGLRVHEIAAREDVPRPTVSYWLARARERL